MSWAVNKAGRASKLAEVIKQAFEDAGGAPKGSAEEAAKNELGTVCETLCKSFCEDRAVRIEASGSAWNTPSGALSQYLSVKFETLGEFVD